MGGLRAEDDQDHCRDGFDGQRFHFHDGRACGCRLFRQTDHGDGALCRWRRRRSLCTFPDAPDRRAASRKPHTGHQERRRCWRYSRQQSVRGARAEGRHRPDRRERLGHAQLHLQGRTRPLQSGQMDSGDQFRPGLRRLYQQLAWHQERQRTAATGRQGRRHGCQ